MLKSIHPSFAVIFFALGIISGDILIHVFRYTFFAPFIWLPVALIALVLTVIVAKPLAMPLAFAAGVVLISFLATPNFLAEKNIKQLYDKEIIVTAKILKDPDTSEKKDKIALTLTDLKFIRNKSENSPILETPGKLYVSLPNKQQTESPLNRSDEITLSGELKAGFGTYLGFMYRPKIIKVIRPDPGDIFLKVRDAFAEKIREYLTDKKESGLALGYLLGIRSGIDENFEDTLRIVGLTHIIVASGTHLSILVSFARKIFGNFSRFSGFFFALIFIACFVGVTGLTPSMTRAAFVSGLSLFAWFAGRDSDPWRILLLVMAVTLLINPMNLIDIAWLLSFGSFGGIMLLAPALKKYLFGDHKSPGPILESILTSLSATALCAPIMLYFFGSLSLISLVANLLILPTIPYVMLATIATGLLSLLNLAPLASLSAKLASLILNYHFTVVNYLGEKTYFLINIEKEDPKVFLLYLFFALPLTFIIIKIIPKTIRPNPPP